MLVRPWMVLATFALVTETAEASCTLAPAVIAPPAGTRLPPHATIYILRPTSTAADIHVHDEENHDRHRMTLVDRSEAFDLARVQLNTPRGKVDVHVGNAPDITSAKYEIADTTDPHRLAIRSITRSGRDTIDFIATGNAIALRFAWDDGTSTIAMLETTGNHLLAQLGELPCVGRNVEPHDLARTRTFVLFAQFTDGSEARLGVSRVQLQERTQRLPTNLVGAAIAPKRCANSEATNVVGKAWFVASGAIAAIALVLAAFFLRRRHEPRG